MKQTQVPQDRAKAFMGRSKALYAMDEDGRYRIAPSNGWEAEEIVLDQAIAEFRRLAVEAHARAQKGRGSSLEYHMYAQRMDPIVLAAAAGLWRWRTRRHLRPGAFEALRPALQRRYAEALGLDAAALKSLPGEA